MGQTRGKSWCNRACLLSTGKDTKVIKVVLEYAKAMERGSRGTREDSGGRLEERTNPAEQEEHDGQQEDDEDEG